MKSVQLLGICGCQKVVEHDLGISKFLIKRKILANIRIFCKTILQRLDTGVNLVYFYLFLLPNCIFHHPPPFSVLLTRVPFYPGAVIDRLDHWEFFMAAASIFCGVQPTPCCPYQSRVLFNCGYIPCGSTDCRLWTTTPSGICTSSWTTFTKPMSFYVLI